MEKTMTRALVQPKPQAKGGYGFRRCGVYPAARGGEEVGSVDPTFNGGEKTAHALARPKPKAKRGYGFQMEWLAT